MQETKLQTEGEKGPKKSILKRLEKEEKNKLSFDLDYKLNILYQDDEIMVINKPAGLMVHGDGRSDVITLSDIVGHQYPELLKVGEDFVFAEDTRTTGNLFRKYTDSTKVRQAV